MTWFEQIFLNGLFNSPVCYAYRCEAYPVYHLPVIHELQVFQSLLVTGNIMKPNVSVILPYFNGKEFVKHAIDSVLSQSYSNIELIIIDDGSISQIDTTYLKDLLDSYLDPRLIYFYTTNSGLAKTRNFGVSHSGAPYIAFIDQDDYWNGDKLHRQMKALQENPEAQFVFTDCALFGETNESSPHPLRRRFNSGFIPDTYVKMLRSNFVPCSSVLFSRQFAQKIGDSNPNFVAVPDYEYFLRIAESCEFFYLNEVLTHIRLHPRNTSKQEMRLYLECIDVLIGRNLPGLRHKVMASRQFCKMIFFVVCLWTRKIVSNNVQNTGLRT